MTNEEWRPIAGFETLYEVSSIGRVRSLGRTVTYAWIGKTKTITKPTKILSPETDKDGYRRVTLSKEDGKTKRFMVHRLMGIAFIPNPNNLPQINHIDFIRSNNVLSNLEWVTPKGNTRHSLKDGRYAKALTAKIVVEIRARHAAGERMSSIGQELGLGHDTVRKIVLRERWGHV